MKDFSLRHLSFRSERGHMTRTAIFDPGPISHDVRLPRIRFPHFENHFGPHVAGRRYAEKSI